MSDKTELQIELEEMKKFNDDLSKFIPFDKFNYVFENTMNLLDVLGENASQQPIINIGGNGTHILFADFFMATSQTLKSITACCKLGCFSDANMLNRKYRDDLFQYLYIIQASKNKKVFDENELDQYFSSEMTEDKFVETVLKAFDIELSDIKKDSRAMGINAWFENTLESSSSKEYRSCFFKTSAYIKYLKENKLVKDCFDTYLKAQWVALDRRKNNFTHGNGKKFIRANNISGRDREEAKVLLDQIIDDVSLTTTCFLSLLILIEPIYISSSYYVDCLDCGLTPPEGSQYWIPSIVQDYIDEFVEKIHSDLKTYLIENNPYSMEIK